MKPTQSLPGNFSLAWSLDLKHNTRLNIILQVLGLVWMAAAGLGLTFCMLFLRPDMLGVLKINASGNLLSVLVLLILVMLVTILLHELVHALFFWIFARHRPEFGIGVGYAFAAMPDWFFPKQKYLVIGLSPLLLLSLLGLAASLIVPQSWLISLLIGLVINAGGAIGDIYVCWRIARDEPEVWIKDSGDVFQLYRANPR